MGQHCIKEESHPQNIRTNDINTTKESILLEGEGGDCVTRSTLMRKLYHQTPTQDSILLVGELCYQIHIDKKTVTPYFAYLYLDTFVKVRCNHIDK